MLSDLIEQARTAIGRARHVLVLTGAGVSQASGVPTFRGQGGLWREHRAESLATPEAFAADPRLVWEWYGWRRSVVARCAPNAAHHAIARLAATRAGVTVVTQNVDGLHDLAHAQAAVVAAAQAGTTGATMGGSPDDPHELGAPITLHGSLYSMRCTACGARRTDRAPIDATSIDTLPRCDCGATMRPDVVWFGEALDRTKLDAAIEAAAQADVCLVVGTSGVVYPAAGLAEVAARQGALVIEINPEPSALTPIAGLHLRGDAAVVVPAVLD